MVLSVRIQATSLGNAASLPGANRCSPTQDNILNQMSLERHVPTKCAELSHLVDHKEHIYQGVRAHGAPVYPLSSSDQVQQAKGNICSEVEPNFFQILLAGSNSNAPTKKRSQADLEEYIPEEDGLQIC